MLPWAGFLGRLIQFAIAKIRGQGLERTLDHKKGAAIAFLKLHDALRQHEIVMRYFLSESTPFIAAPEASTLPSCPRGTPTVALGPHGR